MKAFRSMTITNDRESQQRLQIYILMVLQIFSGAASTTSTDLRPKMTTIQTQCTKKRRSIIMTNLLHFPLCATFFWVTVDNGYCDYWLVEQNYPDRHDGLPKFDRQKLHGVVCTLWAPQETFWGHIWVSHRIATFLSILDVISLLDITCRLIKTIGYCDHFALVPR